MHSAQDIQLSIILLNVCMPLCWMCHSFELPFYWLTLSCVILFNVFIQMYATLPSVIQMSVILLNGIKLSFILDVCHYAECTAFCWVPHFWVSYCWVSFCLLYVIHWVYGMLLSVILLIVGHSLSVWHVTDCMALCWDYGIPVCVILLNVKAPLLLLCVLMRVLRPNDSHFTMDKLKTKPGPSFQL